MKSRKKVALLDEVAIQIEKSCQNFNSEKFEEIAALIDSIGHFATLAECMLNNDDYEYVINPIQSIIKITKDLSGTEHKFMPVN